MVKYIVAAILFAATTFAASGQGYDYITPSEAGIDIYDKLDGHSLAEYDAIRQDVVDHIFPTGLPTGGANYNGPWTPAAWVLSGATQSTQHFYLSYGVVSYTSIYHAPTDGDCLFIYHFGHGEGLRYQWNGSSYVMADPEAGVKTLINGLLAQGCDVAVLQMPFSGENYSNSIPGIVGWNNSSAAAHNNMAAYQTATFTPIRWFIEPVVRIINHALTVESYTKIGMAGKSGGGWTTTLAAAIDPRIQHSYSISGSYPMYLKALRPTTDNGDWEQYQAPIWNMVDYLDLYILGAMGEGRTADLIWRKFDSCCFSGARAFAFMPQLTGVLGRLAIPAPTFFVDSTATVGHLVSPPIAARILSSFASY